MNCEIIGCNTMLSTFHPSETRTDGISVQVLNTGKIYGLQHLCKETWLHKISTEINKVFTEKT